MNPLEDPQAILLRAQRATAEKDYAEAERCFSILIEGFRAAKAQGIPMPNLVMGYLSRSTCRLELGDLDGSLNDAELALMEPDITAPREILPGCTTTRTAAATRIIDIYERKGEADKAAALRAKLTELMDRAQANVARSLELKEAGNAQFKRGAFGPALALYEQALELNPTESTILSNACQAALKLDEVDKAEMLAQRCVNVRPDWSKAWYRQGAVAMRKGMYMRAMQAFQRATQLAPEDAEIRRMYDEAVTKAQETDPNQGGLDMQFAAMMAKLRDQSWDFAGWLKSNWNDVEFMDLDAFAETLGPEVAPDVTAAMRMLHPEFPEALHPMATEAALAPVMPASANNLIRHLMPSDPMLTALIVRRLLKRAEPDSEWTLVWVFGADPRPFVQWRHFSRYVQQHQMYAWLVDRPTRRMVDCMRYWDLYLKAPHATGGEAAVVRGPAAVKQSSGIDIVGHREDVYACDDEEMLVAFLNRVYESNRQQNEQAELERAERDKGPSGQAARVAAEAAIAEQVRQRQAAAAAAGAQADDGGEDAPAIEPVVDDEQGDGQGAGEDSPPEIEAAEAETEKHGGSGDGGDDEATLVETELRQRRAANATAGDETSGEASDAKASPAVRGKSGAASKSKSGLKQKKQKQAAEVQQTQQVEMPSPQRLALGLVLLTAAVVVSLLVLGVIPLGGSATATPAAAADGE
ncbi:hypothetical protein HK105_204228 [Polyrhizophydium stewartii]|uniref:Tetratricopeptide repeat protein n=1 Tax=Polyrhizophydium stewartii TaxID=2732419 RepID=A0ABR4N9E4_9FUNG|nr:hypothetical protein HK105_006672 [Polyrhizophydium stewartii]